VSRVAAIRPAIVRSLAAGHTALPHATAATLSYEFPRTSHAQVAQALSGVEVTGDEWSAPFRSEDFLAILRGSRGEPVVAELSRQTELFGRHLRATLGHRYHGVLIDTGLYGTTRALLAEGLPDLAFSSALIARSYRPGLARRSTRTFGLSVEATGYSPWRRRTAMLRYWHFVEWLFEPDLPSVRGFTEVGGEVRADLQVDGWQERIAPPPGSAAAGVLSYLDALPPGSGAKIVEDADRAWGAFRRTIVWPGIEDARALAVGTRSHDFGKDATWTERPWSGPLGALRGTSMWREGEIARSGTPLRAPLLVTIEAAHTLRHAKRAVARKLGR
jgi:hypothetical protein